MVNPNKPRINFRHEKKKKERVKRKERNTVQKHRLGVKLVSGKRTKKAQRRAIHQERVAEGPLLLTSAPQCEALILHEVGVDAHVKLAAKMEKQRMQRITNRDAVKKGQNKPVAMQE